MTNNRFAVLLDEEVKEKLNVYIQNTGQTNEEFVDQLISLYEIQLKRESLSEVKEFEHLKNHLARIEDIFTEYKKFTQHRRMADDAQMKEIQESMQQSKAQFFNMQKQVELIKQEASETVRVIEAEAAMTREV